MSFKFESLCNFTSIMNCPSIFDHNDAIPVLDVTCSFFFFWAWNSFNAATIISLQLKYFYCHFHFVISVFSLVIFFFSCVFLLLLQQSFQMTPTANTSLKWWIAGFFSSWWNSIPDDFVIFSFSRCSGGIIRNVVHCCLIENSISLHKAIFIVDINLTIIIGTVIPIIVFE